MHRILLDAGFRMRSMCVTMPRTGDLGQSPIRTPYSIEKDADQRGCHVDKL
jgi:hypothetical protein